MKIFYTLAQHFGECGVSFFLKNKAIQKKYEKAGRSVTVVEVGGRKSNGIIISRTVVWSPTSAAFRNSNHFVIDDTESTHQEQWFKGSVRSTKIRRLLRARFSAIPILISNYSYLRPEKYTILHFFLAEKEFKIYFEYYEAKNSEKFHEKYTFLKYRDIFSLIATNDFDQIETYLTSVLVFNFLLR